MDLKPALIKKLSDMQNSLVEEDPDRKKLESLKKQAEAEADDRVILQMILLTNSLIQKNQTPLQEEGAR